MPLIMHVLPIGFCTLVLFMVFLICKTQAIKHYQNRIVGCVSNFLMKLSNLKTREQRLNSDYIESLNFLFEAIEFLYPKTFFYVDKISALGWPKLTWEKYFL